MGALIVHYDVVRNGKTIFDDDAIVYLTYDDYKEFVNHILDDHFSGNLRDLPSQVYESIRNSVWETATKTLESKSRESLKENDDVIIQLLYPLKIDILKEGVVTKKSMNGEPHLLSGGSKEVVDDLYGSQSSIVYIPENDYWLVDGHEEPSKGNTLFLPIRKILFDQIVSGEKNIELRVIKPSDYKKYLQCDGEGYPWCDIDEIAEGYEDHNADIYIWNDGHYPFMPNLSLRYLKLAVNTKKAHETALVELNGIKYFPVIDESGNPNRFIETDDKFVFTPNGNLCMWYIGFLIKRVVKVDRAKKE